MSDLFVQAIETSLDSGNQDMMFFVLPYFLDTQIFDAGSLLIIPEIVAIISAQAIVCAKPDISLFILEDMAHSIGCKTVGRSKVTALQHVFCPKAGAVDTYTGNQQYQQEVTDTNAGFVFNL